MTRAAELDLIVQAKAGDAQALADLIRAHQASLYAFMLRITGRPDVAEDVVQEAFVRVLQNLDRFDPKYRFSTWLFTIAKRLYVNWSQKFRPSPESELVYGWESPVADSWERKLDWDEERQAVRVALDLALASLGETQREIVILFHQLDWSIRGISEYLQMPEGTIKSHLHRARRKMREVITSHANGIETMMMAEARP